MNDCCDLELTIHRQDQKYAVDFRFSDPNSQADVGAGARTEMFASFDPGKLQGYLIKGDMKGYGEELTRQFFSDNNLVTEFSGFRRAIEREEDRLRVRLNIRPSAQALYRFRWETLRDPGSGVKLATDQRIYFSRYLLSKSARRVPARPKGQLKVLVLVASPEGLKDYDPPLAEVKKTPEVEAIRSSLGDATIEVLEKATLDGLTEALGSNEYDVLYVVAHGVFKGKDESEGYLLLEDEDGKEKRASATEFVNRMSELEHPPRLIVLASCQSGGSGTGDILSSLGPRLAEVGIPAVLAMQDDLTMKTNARFMPRFFEELQKDGQIDRALNVARSQVQEEDDFWVPVLFMRLKDGRLWEVPAGQLASQGVEGIKASAALLKLSPEAYSRTIKSFETASQQIERMATYKDLHDLLHKLQVDIYNMAIYPAADFPKNARAGAELLQYKAKMGRLVSDLKGILASPAVDPREKDWVGYIEIAYQTLDKALTTGDATLLRNALDVLKSVIVRQPTVINGILTKAAGELQLKMLAEALSGLSKEAQEGSLDAARLGQIQEGAEAILALSNKLTALVNDHDAWQGVSDKWGNFEESQMDMLKILWPSLKVEAGRLYLDREEDWATQLSAASDALDQALAGNNPWDLTQAFITYQSGVVDRFFKVDTDLKNLCGEVRKISDPLKKALEDMERSAK